MLPIGDQDQDQDLKMVCQLADFFVCGQGGGTPLNSDLDQAPGEEAIARQVEPGGMEELWREGSNFSQSRRISM